MASIPDDLICTGCGEKNLDTEADFNMKDMCVYCVDEMMQDINSEVDSWGQVGQTTSKKRSTYTRGK